MSLKVTFSEILDILEPVSRLTDAEKQRFRILQRKLGYQLQNRDKHVKECDELLDALKERDKYKRIAEENAGELLVTCRLLDNSQAELERTKLRLADSERLLRECSKEYNELQNDLAVLKERLREKIPPSYAEEQTLQ